MRGLLIGLLLTSGMFQTYNGGTLVLVAATQDSVLIGADSLVTNSTSKINHKNKILQLGPSAACAFTGATEVSEKPHGMGDHVDLKKIAAEWAAEHPQVSLTDGFEAISKLLIDSQDKFFEKHHSPTMDQSTPATTFTCVGLKNGKPWANARNYYYPSGKITQNHQAIPMGEFHALGAAGVAEEVTSGYKVNFAEEKMVPAVRKYRQYKHAKQTPLLSQSEWLELFKACFRATESKEGRQFDKESVDVAGPHDFAIIDKTGFHWIEKNNSRN